MCAKSSTFSCGFDGRFDLRKRINELRQSHAEMRFNFESCTGGCQHYCKMCHTRAKQKVNHFSTFSSLHREPWASTHRSTAIAIIVESSSHVLASNWIRRLKTNSEKSKNTANSSSRVKTFFQFHFSDAAGNSATRIMRVFVQ